MQKIETIGPSREWECAARARSEITGKSILASEHSNRTSDLSTLVWSAASGSVERLALVRRGVLG